MDIDSVSVIDGAFPVIIVVATMVSLLASLGWRSTQQRRRGRSSDEWSVPELRRRPTWIWQLLLGIPIAAALIGLIALVDDGFALVPFQFPNSFYLWLSFIPLALAICVVGWPGAPWWRRAMSVISVTLACVFALTLINAHYQYYPNVGALLGKEAQYEVDDAQLKQAQLDYRQTKKLPAHGFTITKHIPGPQSKFNARDAYIWVPPEWVESPTRNSPSSNSSPATPASRPTGRAPASPTKQRRHSPQPTRGAPPYSLCRTRLGLT